jgi:hypothetical protein
MSKSSHLFSDDIKKQGDLWQHESLVTLVGFCLVFSWPVKSVVLWMFYNKLFLSLDSDCIAAI